MTRVSTTALFAPLWQAPPDTSPRSAAGPPTRNACGAWPTPPDWTG